MNLIALNNADFVAKIRIMMMMMMEKVPSNSFLHDEFLKVQEEKLMSFAHIKKSVASKSIYSSSPKKTSGHVAS